MKTPPFLLIGCPLLVLLGAIIYLATFRELHRTPFHAALIEAETVPPPSGHLRAILAQLNLTDAQRQQIDQLRHSTSDRTQRRQQIFNLLTPEQRAKWQALHAQQNAPAAPSTNTP